jgi:hypothetical protein
MSNNVVDLAAKRAPVDYTIRIRHHWDDSLEVFVEDVSDDERSKQSVADTLERAAQVFRAALEGKKDE